MIIIMPELTQMKVFLKPDEISPECEELHNLKANLLRDVVGIRIVKEGDTYMLGVSWRANEIIKYKNFHKLSVHTLSQSWFPQLAKANPTWAEKLYSWLKAPTSILSVGKLR